MAAVAFLSALTPVTAFATWLFATGAIVLAMIALVKKVTPRWLPIAAIVVAPIAWIIAIVVAVTGIALVAGGSDSGSSQPPAAVAPVASESPTSTPTPTATPTPTPTPTPTETAAEVVAEEVVAEPPAPATPVAPAAPALSLSQQNAIGTAESYLDFMGFSRTGLIDQLAFEGYSAEDATFAVDTIAPDWNVQAGVVAQNYLDTMAFSREGLLDQLIFEGFTPEQASAGLAAVGY